MSSSITFHYSMSGSNLRPAVLFVHGFMGDLRDWDTVVEKLGEDFCCLAVDLPGHGATRVEHDRGYGILETATALVELIDELDLATVSLVGYSMGGRLALYLTVMFAARVDVAILESGSPGLATEDERDARRLGDEALAERLESDDFERFLRDWYGQPLFETLRNNGPRFQALLERRRHNDAQGLAASLRGMGTGSQPSLWEDLKAITAPLHLVVGEQDEKFRGIAHAMAERCMAAQVHEVAGCGHNVHYEKPTEYTRLLRRLLSNP